MICKLNVDNNIFYITTVIQFLTLKIGGVLLYNNIIDDSV